MLILTRRVQESLRVGDDLVVTVLAVKGGSVRLGISGPRSMPVYREEIYKRMQAEKAAEEES